MRIGLLTTFSAMVEHYSLTAVVLDQARMIHHAGHQPVILALEDFRWDEKPDWLEVRSGLPFYHKTDYQTSKDVTEDHWAVAARAFGWLTENCRDLDAIFTHDILYTGWNLPVNIAVQKAAAVMDTYWLHWIHSVPGGLKKDFWRLPPNGKLVFPNHSDRMRCAEHFCIEDSGVAVIPHSVDPRNFLMTTQIARQIATDFDLLAADFVQTFPVPTDRMEHKGISQVIQILGQLKNLGRSVKLVVCNSWCNVPKWHDKVRVCLDYAAKHGLNEREVIFTSRVASDLGIGVPNRAVRDLMLISNLFICPTKSETFGIAIAEAALCGQLLVLNSNLPALPELAGPGNALFFTFGSLQQKVDCADWPAFYRDVARCICHRFDTSDALKAKTHYRKTYSMDAVWNKIEALLQAEAIGTAVAVGRTA